MPAKVYGSVPPSVWSGVERVLQQPDRVEPDPVDAELEHRLGRIPEYDGRVLRVIVKKATNPLRIITCYLIVR